MSTILWSDPFAKGEDDFTERITRLVSSSPGLDLRREDFKVATEGKPGLEDLWMFFEFCSAPRHCNLWLSIYCKQFKVIPSFCRYRCWKTVIRPRTVKELFDLERLLRGFRLPSKCGIDIRNYSFGPYGGYLYADNLKEGQEYCKFVREQVSKIIHPDVPVFLKRACTEMEQQLPSDQWDPQPPEEEYLERKLDAIFVKEDMEGTASEWFQNKVKTRWIKQAIMIGDPTWKEVVPEKHWGNFKIPHVVHYETWDAYINTRSTEDLNPYIVGLLAPRNTENEENGESE